MTDTTPTNSTNETGPDVDAGADSGTDATDGTGTDATLQLGDEATTFSRDYVEALRAENAGHRNRTREAETTADTLARNLWAERVAALNLLADPADLEYDADLLHDRDAIEAAARALIESKPHLRSRIARGSIGQGQGSADTPVSLLGLLKRGA